MTAVPGPFDPPAGLGAGAPADLTDPPTQPIPGTGRPALGHGPRPDRPGLGWTEIAVAAVVYVVAQLALGLVAVVLGGGTLPSAPWLIALSAASAFAAVGVALVLRVRAPVALGLRRVRPRLVAIGAAIGLGAWVVSRVLVVAYVAVTGDGSDPQQDLTSFTGVGASIAVVVIGGLLVPFGEELLFRGILFGGLRRYGLVVAAAASGLVFGLAHGLNAVFAAALLLGVVNCVLYERTRSIWPAVAAHAVFNLVSFSLLLALGP